MGRKRDEERNERHGPSGVHVWPRLAALTPAVACQGYLLLKETAFGVLGEDRGPEMRAVLLATPAREL